MLPTCQPCLSYLHTDLQFCCLSDFLYDTILKPTMLLSIQHCFRIAVELWESWSVALSTVAMKAVRAMFLVYQVRLALVLSTSTSSITATRLAAKKCLPQLGSELVLMMSHLA